MEQQLRILPFLFETRRVWSLLDVTNYCVRDLHAILLWIEQMVNFAPAQSGWTLNAADVLPGNEHVEVFVRITALRMHCNMLELPETAIACDSLLSNLGRMTLGECRGHLRSIGDTITKTLSNRLFMYLPTRFARYVTPHRHPAILRGPGPESPVKPFGETVYQKFEKARNDAEQAALCVAAGANTAAVFHLMRVVEWGIRALGAELGMRKVTEGTKRIPIESLTWGRLQDHIQAKVNRRIASLRPGPSRESKVRFYSEVLQDFRGFKDAWRNHVMHTRAEYGESDALRVLSHVERFMQSLADWPGTRKAAAPRLQSGQPAPLPPPGAGKRRAGHFPARIRPV